jgi:Fic family protein
MKTLQNYPHISFNKKWKLSNDVYFELGQCEAIIKALSETPIQPEFRQNLLHVSLIKGAQSTTAIEGNTLTEEEIEVINKGGALAPSKEYQQKEIRNIIVALNTLFQEVLERNCGEEINPDFILRLHKMVGNDLGDHFQAVPGRFRQNNVTVGGYRPPDHKYVIQMIEDFCLWIKDEFHFKKGQNFIDSVTQSIVCHAYIAWIHPFGDGNGRTARLLEFYILLRSGSPDFASHLLSNFYNSTRPEYYNHLDKSTKTGDLSEFIQYAVKGYRDGLYEILGIVQKNQVEISWNNYIHSAFTTKDMSGKAEAVNKRRRKLILAIPFNQSYTIDEMIKLNVEIALMYNNLSVRTIDRDIKDLLEIGLLTKDKDAKYKANIGILKNYFSMKIIK